MLVQKLSRENVVTRWEELQSWWVCACLVFEFICLQFHGGSTALLSWVDSNCDQTWACFWTSGDWIFDFGATPKSPALKKRVQYGLWTAYMWVNKEASRSMRPNMPQIGNLPFLLVDILFRLYYTFFVRAGGFMVALKLLFRLQKYAHVWLQPNPPKVPERNGCWMLTKRRRDHAESPDISLQCTPILIEVGKER